MAKLINISEDHIDILHYIQNDSVLSQRQMSQKTGLSVGKVNYILKSLLDIGFIKIDHFNKSPKKSKSVMSKAAILGIIGFCIWYLMR